MPILSKISGQFFLICITLYPFTGTAKDDLVFPAFYIDNNIGGFQKYLADNIILKESRTDSVDISFSVDTFGFPERIEVKGDSVLRLQVYKAIGKARFAPAIRYVGNSRSFLVEYDANFRIVFNAPYDSVNKEEVRDAADYKLIQKESGAKRSISLTCLLKGDSVPAIRTGEIWVAVNGDYSDNQKVQVNNGLFKVDLITEGWETYFFDIAFQFDKYKTLVIRNVPLNHQKLIIPITYNGQKQQMNYFGSLESLKRLPVKT